MVEKTTKAKAKFENNDVNNSNGPQDKFDITSTSKWYQPVADR